MAEEEIPRGERKQEVNSEPKFKIGDTVLILKRFETHEADGVTQWPSDKDNSIGKLGTVCKITTSKHHVTMYRVDFDDNQDAGNPRWNYPEFVLKKMSKWQLKKHLEKKQ